MGVSGAKKRIDDAVQGWRDVATSPHRFGGTEYRFERREIGHVHDDSLVDIPFPKKVRDELVTAAAPNPTTSFPRAAGSASF